MSKHDQRDHRGRFTKSGAPIDGDTSALEHVIAPSADPRGEHNAPGYPSFDREYPTREFTNPDGSYSPLRGRRPVVVNTETGEQLDAQFSDARYPHYNGPDTMRSMRRAPGSDGNRLQSMYDRDHEAEWRGGR
jgi:hypothetical protein